MFFLYLPHPPLQKKNTVKPVFSNNLANSFCCNYLFGNCCYWEHELFFSHNWILLVHHCVWITEETFRFHLILRNINQCYLCIIICVLSLEKYTFFVYLHRQWSYKSLKLSVRFNKKYQKNAAVVDKCCIYCVVMKGLKY